MILGLPNRPVLILIVALLVSSPDLFAQRSFPVRASETFELLAPKLEKELGKAVEALRANNPAAARKHLDTVYRLVPRNTEANFLFGIYSAEMNDWIHARVYWEKALVLSPSHFGALLSVGYALMRENKSTEAVQYLQRAAEAEPMSWRAHALLADACFQQGLVDESIKQAERALELGHRQADIVQPLLVRALRMQGRDARAHEVLQAYRQDHPADPSRVKQPENLQVLLPENSEPSDYAPPAPAPVPAFAASALLPSHWLPPDIDEKVPAVESSEACNVKEVLESAGKRLEEFIADVDRFTATETVTHQSINKWGLPSHPVRFQFNYLVAVKKNRLGLLNVEEYRGSHYSPDQFPDSVATTGLPALILIFHPSNVQNFEITCEGLARSNGAPAWQIHFRQRADKPNTIRTYQLGTQGPVYSVPLKGRAWIAANTFQIVRLETDLVAPVPEIRLVADHAAIEYAPVHFNARNVNMWLPQTAEIHYDWRGRRTHRRHHFSNYLLFAVEDKQQISDAKAVAPSK